MSRSLLPVLSILSCIAQVLYATQQLPFPKCDPNIIRKIEKLWGGHPPKNIISKGLQNGKEFVVATSKDYYPEDVSESFTYFVKGRDLSTARVDIYEVLTKYGTVVPKTIYLVEDYGTLYDYDNKTRRIHVYLDFPGGVTGTYACSDSCDAVVGPPAGAVKRRAYNYDQDSLTKAIQLLWKLGIELTDYLDMSY